MLAVVFALPEESQDFRALIEEPQIVGRGAELVASGKIAEREIVAAHTGMGADAAMAGMREILGRWQPRLVIGSGFAGGLQPHLAVGDVVCDWRGVAGFELPEGAQGGTLVVAEKVVETAAEKAELGRKTGALAVDMESAAGARVCAEAGVPFVAVRAISDPVDFALPVPLEEWFDLGRQQPRVARLLWFLARHPARIAPFAGFVRGLPKARRALAEALVAVIRQVE